MNYLLTGILLAAMYYTIKKPKLRFFKPLEFGFWYPLVNDDLLLKLDKLRGLWGYPIEISTASGAVGRFDDSESQHNVAHTGGTIKAVDVFPKLPNGEGGWRYMQTASERRAFYQVALQAGFNGIGLYVDTMPGDMAHLDIRGVNDSSRATWSRISGQYRGINEVLA